MCHGDQAYDSFTLLHAMQATRRSRRFQPLPARSALRSPPTQKLTLSSGATYEGVPVKDATAFSEAAIAVSSGTEVDKKRLLVVSDGGKGPKVVDLGAGGLLTVHPEFTPADVAAEHPFQPSLPSQPQVRASPGGRSNSASLASSAQRPQPDQRAQP